MRRVGRFILSELYPSPSIFGGFRLLFLVVVLLMILGAIKGHSETMPPSAEWYADHPAVRERVVAACRDNPGAARRNDHCAAASQGNLIAAAREASARAPLDPFDNTPPSSPRYWAARPEARREFMEICRRAEPSWRARNNCRAAGYT
ncbi:hypothetical protein EAH89_25595 [Roseomonas nepalensis]|uniref:Uncharacterized protein n=1 Tax=Muricoccus nepalensis TaxID=1854500 RepID=A0A502F9F0_9PROT|nr:EexN family lipoprotein [Roseomonas nepalensis]TPG46000.1 hypothetical protein EAH89_25595 [Roseomonas nepalensis]